MGPEKLHVPFLYKMKMKREGTGFPIPSQKVQNMDFFLAEVPLQQALEGLAVAGLVAGHLVHGVYDACNCNPGTINRFGRYCRTHASHARESIPAIKCPKCVILGGLEP